MPHLTIATTASANPMGAQAYSAAIIDRAQSALELLEPGWRVTPQMARSLRSPLKGTHRLPMGWLYKASPTARRAAGRLIYPRGSVVHRMDLTLPPPPGPDVATLHDLVAWDFEDESDPVRAAAVELRHADAVICVSKFTAGTAIERMGLTNTVVVPNGVSQAYFGARALSPDDLRGLGLRAPFVLYSGGSARRKNLPALAEAWRRVAPLQPEWQLALTGSRNPKRDQLFAALPRVVHLGRIEDSLMPALMTSASAAVVPSLYEGFGLPALEAMAAGVPLVASNRTSLPEVVGNGGTLVEPTPEGLAEGLETVMSRHPSVDALRRSGLERAKQFTWERSARGHARVWSAVL